MVPGSLEYSQNYSQNYGLVSLLLPVGPFSFAGGTSPINVRFVDPENDVLQLIGTEFGSPVISSPGIYTTAQYASDIIQQTPWVDKFHLRCSSLGNSKPGSEEPNDAPHGLRAQVSEEDIASAISG
jgi:hypothetical protein